MDLFNRGLFGTRIRLSNHEKARDPLNDSLTEQNVSVRPIFSSVIVGILCIVMTYFFAMIYSIVHAWSPKERRMAVNNDCATIVHFHWRRSVIEDFCDCYQPCGYRPSGKPDVCEDTYDECIDYCNDVGWDFENGFCDGFYLSDCQKNIADMCFPKVKSGPNAKAAMQNPYVHLVALVFFAIVFAYLEYTRNRVLKKYHVKVNVNNLIGDNAKFTLPVLATKEQILSCINGSGNPVLKDFDQINVLDHEGKRLEPCHNGYYDMTPVKTITVVMTDPTPQTPLLRSSGVSERRF